MFSCREPLSNSYWNNLDFKIMLITTREAEIGRIRVQGHPGQKVNETSFQQISHV
jgi:hypothetical protein